MRVLVADDDPVAGRILSAALRSWDLEVEVVFDGDAAWASMNLVHTPLAIVDWMMPGIDGPELCRRLRANPATANTYILLLTARESSADMVHGLDAGADDYITKPFDTIELLARIEAHLRRAAAATAPGAPVYEFGDITMDVRKAEVRRNGTPIDLSAREFLLLKYFIEHREATLTRDELLNDVWGYHSMPSTRTVDVHVAWLRQKIEPDVKHPQYIVTVHGLGYKFIG